MYIIYYITNNYVHTMSKNHNLYESMIKYGDEPKQYSTHVYVYGLYRYTKHDALQQITSSYNILYFVKFIRVNYL